MFRPPYDDHFKASALEMLYAAGYPSLPQGGVQRGALIGVARAVGVHVATLRRWVIACQDETSPAHLTGVGPATSPPGPLSVPFTERGSRGAKITDRKETDVRRASPIPDAIRAELLATLTSMAAARSDATYKELSAGFAVLAEKLRQLEPAPDGPPETSTGEAHDRLSRMIGVGDVQSGS